MKPKELIRYETELREKQLENPVVIPRISHFVDDNGYLYDNYDQDILVENESGIIKFYKIDFNSKRYLKAIYEV